MQIHFIGISWTPPRNGFSKPQILIPSVYESFGEGIKTSNKNAARFLKHMYDDIQTLHSSI